MVFGMLHFWAQARDHFRQRFGDPVNDDEFIEQAIAGLEQGMAHPPKPPSANRSSSASPTNRKYNARHSRPLAA